MHERSLLENVLEIVQDNAATQSFKQVKKICLEIGKLSCVEPEALRFSFDQVMKNTLADHAELEIIQTDGAGICGQCDRVVQLETLHDPCSVCGSFEVSIMQGNEMSIKELRVI